MGDEPPMHVNIRYCQAWGFRARAASLAANIKDATGVESELEVGAPGRLDVLIDGELVASRGGGFFARLFGGGWPDPARVIEAVRSRAKASW